MTSICSREEIDLVKPRTAVRPERRPRVAVDVRGLQQALRNSPEGGLGGVGRYGFHLLEAFQQREETDQVLLVDKGPVPKRLLELAAGSELVFRGYAAGWSWVSRASGNRSRVCWWG